MMCVIGSTNPSQDGKRNPKLIFIQLVLRVGGKMRRRDYIDWFVLSLVFGTMLGAIVYLGGDALAAISTVTGLR